MEFTLRSVRFGSRLLRRSILVKPHNKSITGSAAVKTDSNMELLNSFNEDIKAGGVVPVFRRALLFPARVALQDDIGIYTYGGLHQAAADLSKEISMQLVGETEKTISYMCSNNASHVIVQWAIWMTGNIAVPLTPLHPPEMLKYFIGDSLSSLIVCTQEYEDVLRPVSLELSVPLLTAQRDKEITAQLYHPTTPLASQPETGLTDVGKSNSFYGGVEAMIIYTSGTTSKPKGVVWSHSMLSTQISALQSAWQYSANDVVLHTLPLHHIHGQLNSMNASLASGARVRMLSTFAAHAVWARLLGVGERDDARVTVYHGVPSVYARLVDEHGRLFRDARTAQYVRASLSSRVRLACCGSAPLPRALLGRWEEISGLRLLERYGMTEAGMALSNPYSVEGRSAGSVGLPLPGVEARLAEPETLKPLVTVKCEAPEEQICLNRLGLSPSKDSFVLSNKYNWSASIVTKHVPSEDGAYQGELLLKGPGVFKKYWNRSPDESRKDFTSDGWFRTGDTASFADNQFTILGRTSIDIIKTNGYKVSALQVESAILEHPNIFDAAVVGIEDETIGELISCIVVLKDKSTMTLQELRDELKKWLAPYQIPKYMLVVDDMPRNTMGKLDKRVIKGLIVEQLANKK